MLNYLTKTRKNARSKEEALELALKELNVSEAEVNVTVIEESSKGFLGLGAKEAVVEVEIKDVQAYAAKMFLGDIFKGMNLEVKIDITRQEETMLVELSGDHMGIIIGKRGDTLDSLQYLTSLVVNKGKGKDEYIKVTLDTENYRQKRQEALVALAARLADKVERSGKKYTLEPMNPYERRIIHANLQSNEAVTTFSIGVDPYRKIVIAPKNEKPYSRKKSYKKDETVEKTEAVMPLESVDEDLPMTYPGGGQSGRYNKNKVSSFEEYLAKESGDLLD